VGVVRASLRCVRRRSGVNSTSSFWVSGAAISGAVTGLGTGGSTTSTASTSTSTPPVLGPVAIPQ